MAKRGMGRRGFLRGALAGGVAGSAAFWRARETEADGRGTARRMVVFFTPNGTIHRHWRPTGGRTDFDFASGDILEPLRDQRDRLLVLDGLDFKAGNNHEGGMAAMLTGSGGAGHESGGMSIDQYVASQLGGDTPFASLELGVQTSAWGGNVQTRMSYSGPGSYVPPNDRPGDVYRRVFGGVASEPAEVDAVMARRGSVLDLIRDELGDLQRRAPRSERPKIEAHLDALRAAETSLMVPGATGECGAPAVAEMDAMANDNFPMVGRTQMDLLVASLACSATRVASIQWSHTVGPVVFSWLGISEGHHSLSHIDDGNPAGIADFVAAERWFAEQFSYLLTRMDETPDPDGGGSLLDTSLVLWAQELGDGRLHVCESVPWILAGGACGYLQQGQYLTYDGVSHTKALTSICRAMGLENRTFGDPALGTGELDGVAA